MKHHVPAFAKTKLGAAVILLAALAAGGWLFAKAFYEPVFEWYVGVKNGPLTYDTSVAATPAEFEKIALELTSQRRQERADALTLGKKDAFTRKVQADMLMNTASFSSDTDFKHIKYFRDAGILRYEGPKTCLRCHADIPVRHADGTSGRVDTMDDVVNSVHFTFQRRAAGFSTYGYNGRQVNAEGRPVPVGKIDRACGIPGSFTWTGWAALVKSRPASAHGQVVLRSEGCGQCHIGGNYQPATEKMLPFGDVPRTAKEGIDCLICHAQAYDMNEKYVIQDSVGLRWNQDRSLKAAMSVTKPSNKNCLNCHQHNFGGDTYADNAASHHPGYKNPRILHDGAKRGMPFDPKEDVHAAAGIQCLDCHVPEGHLIPRGTKGTDLVANDLPNKVVACENCHTSAPHTKNKLQDVVLNGHVARIACETCHIKQLRHQSVVLRDWVHPTYNPEEGMYVFTDVLQSGKADEGFRYFWYNGNGTFLANALGDNPDKSGRYNPLMDQMTRLTNPRALDEVRRSAKASFHWSDKQIDDYLRPIVDSLSQLTPEMLAKRRAMVAQNIAPIQDLGDSRIYPFKIFNAMMYEDMSNQGPFGAMLLPFDYPTYYETGVSSESVRVAVLNPIIRRMYQYPFKVYMMDAFMRYFGVGAWSDVYPIGDDGKLRNVEAHWMRQYGTLMLNHSIKKDGLMCSDCHSSRGVIEFKALGYSEQRTHDLENLPEVKYFKKTSAVKTAYDGIKTGAAAP